jgi:S1-C subfamily serine protease
MKLVFTKCLWKRIAKFCLVGHFFGCLWMMGLSAAANNGCGEVVPPLPLARQPLTNTDLNSHIKQVTVRVQTSNVSGSGVIFDRVTSQVGSRYRILTNAHNLLKADTAQIQTSDGQLHNAIRTHTQVLTANDLAVLEFTSPNIYRSAEWSQKSITKDTAIVAAGFEFDLPEVTMTLGEVSLVLPQPLKRGYQLGYSGRIRQGMSGGPILDQTGLLLGVNAVSAYPIVNRGYVFADGTRPSPATIKQLRRSNWGIPVAPYLACIR